MQLPRSPPLGESVLDIASAKMLNRQGQIAPGQQFIGVGCQRITGSRKAPPYAQKDGETTDRT